MTTIGNIGIGLFILIIIWILALIIFVLGVKYQSNIGWIALLFATLFTAILVVIPTEKRDKHIEELEITEKDYALVYKNIVFASLILSAIVGFFFFFILHCIEPVRVKVAKTFNVT